MANPKTTLRRFKIIFSPENTEQFLKCTDAYRTNLTHLLLRCGCMLSKKKTFLEAFFCCFRAAFLRPMEGGEQPTRGPHFVGKKEELIKTKRTVVTAGGRDILVIHHQEVFYALDCYCYREYNSDISYKYHSIKCTLIVTR